MKPMQTRRVIAALNQAGCRFVRGDGRHSMYRCPCGQHVAAVPASHRMIKAGVIRSIIRQLPCLKEGWLQ